MNIVIVTIKIAVVLFVIVAGLFYIKASNYSPFIPPAGSPPAGGAQSTPSLLQDLGFAPGSFGVTGIFTGAAAQITSAGAGARVDTLLAGRPDEQARPARDDPTRLGPDSGHHLHLRP